MRGDTEAGRLAGFAPGVAGPDDQGRWTLAVPIAQRDSALARLRASPLVDAAEAP